MRRLLLLALSGLLIGVVSTNFPSVLIKGCLRDTKVKVLDLALLYGNQNLPATQPAKCYLTCLFDAVGFTAGNKINPDILTAGSGTPYMKMIESCKDVQATEECDIGYEVYTCLRGYSMNAVRNGPSEETKVMVAVE